MTNEHNDHVPDDPADDMPIRPEMVMALLSVARHLPDGGVPPDLEATCQAATVDEYAAAMRMLSMSAESAMRAAALCEEIVAALDPWHEQGLSTTLALAAMDPQERARVMALMDEVAPALIDAGDPNPSW